MQKELRVKLDVFLDEIEELYSGSAWNRLNLDSCIMLFKLHSGEKWCFHDLQESRLHRLHQSLIWLQQLKCGAQLPAPP